MFDGSLIGNISKAKHQNQSSQKNIQTPGNPEELDKFSKVLNKAAEAVLPAEETHKQKLRKDKELIENGEGMTDEDDDSVPDKLKAIKKSFKQIVESDRRRLGL